jgi:hypothetical protein
VAFVAESSGMSFVILMGTINGDAVMILLMAITSIAKR